MKPTWKTTQPLRALVHGRRDSVPGTDEFDRILVVELTRLGDVLSMLPAVRLLVSRCPSATVHLFVDTRYASLLQGLDLDIQVHGISESTTAAGLLRAVRYSRSLKVRLACSMSPAKRNVLVTLTSGSRFKIGYLRAVRSLTHYHASTHVESRGFALRKEILYGYDHIEERGLKVCEGLGLRSDGPPRPLVVRPGVFHELRNRLEREGVLPDGGYVVFHPFSAWSYKSWSLANYFELAHLFTSRMGVEVVFLFALHERAEWEKFHRYWRGQQPPRVFASGDLLESAVLLKGSALFVGNDSGPLHLAACLGVPRVGLFGPSSPSLTAPRAGNGTYLYRAVECSPCGQVTCIRPEAPCMNLITPSEVYAAAVTALRNSRSTLTAAHG